MVGEWKAQIGSGIFGFSAVNRFCVLFGRACWKASRGKRSAVKRRGMKQDAWWPRIAAAEQPN
jgi:hypothetical protein